MPDTSPDMEPGALQIQPGTGTFWVAQDQVGPPAPVGSQEPPGVRFNVSNQGNGSTGVSFAIEGSGKDHFMVSSTTCSGLLEPDSSCNVWVVYAPKAAGQEDAILLANASNGSGTSAKLDGHATVSTGGLLIDPPMHDFGFLTSNGGLFTFTVRNVGQDHLRHRGPVDPTTPGAGHCAPTATSSPARPRTSAATERWHQGPAAPSRSSASPARGCNSSAAP
jgi:hypothetical protein